MIKMFLYFVIISVIESFTCGSLILMGDSGKTLIGRIHPGSTRSKRSISLKDDVGLRLSKIKISDGEFSHVVLKPEANAASSIRKTNTSSHGLEVYTVSTKLEIQSPANTTENNSSKKTSNKHDDLKNKEITIPNIDDNGDGLQRLGIYKRFGEEFRYFFMNNIRRWFYRRHGYFDSIASTILKKRET